MAQARKPRKEKATRNEAAEILDFVESAMVRRLTERQILRLVRERYNLGVRQGYRYMEQVRERWSDEANATDREERRNHLRKSLEDVYSKSMSTTATKPDPDVRSASRAAKLLMELDALAAPTKIDLTGSFGVAATAVPAKTRDGLEAWLRGERQPKP